jgi:uncharacterized membrane protein YqhA
MELVRGILGTSRLLIVFAVLGSFITSAALMVYGLLRSIVIVIDVVRGQGMSTEVSKDLIVTAVSIIDIFLLATVLYIVSAGLFQLFVDEGLRLPAWLTIRSIDDLKVRLAGVIVVGLLVAFLGYVVQWTGGFDVLGPGLAIAAVIAATGLYFRLVHDRGGPTTPEDEGPTA